MSDNIQNNIQNVSNIPNISLENNLQLIPSINLQEIPVELKETVIKFNLENNEIYKKNDSQKYGIFDEKKTYNISPIVRKTPNSKTDIIIHKIYTNRKNVIKNYQNTLSNSSTNNSNIVSSRSLIYQGFGKNNNHSIYNLCKNDNSCNNSSNVLSKLRNNDQLYNNENLRISNINNINNINNDESPLSDNKTIKIQDNSSSENSPDKPVTPLSDDSVSSDLIQERNIEKRKRKYYRTIKYKDNKNPKIKPINIDDIETPKSSPSESPRDITQDLWNDLIENYYIEFQKLCKDESNKYKYLSHKNELISNILKFILLISGCFTFTLSITVANSLFMNTTTIVSSCLTAIITSLNGFFQFDKKSEIQYNIYRELDKLYNTISLEMLKPTYMRPDPYEFILSLRNRKDELMKTLQKK